MNQKYITIQLTKLAINKKLSARFDNRHMEFHVSREARLKYLFDETLYSKSGNAIFPNFRAARQFAQKMNEKKDLINFPEKSVKTGHINAMGLIDEILHHAVQMYREQINSNIIKDALESLENEFGKDAVDATLQKFLEDFPPRDVHTGKLTSEKYLATESDGVSHREITLEEMILLWLANENPAFSPYLELFDDTGLEKETSYRKILEHLYKYFDSQPAFGRENENLIDMLKGPARKFPHSLTEQLDYIRSEWGLILGKYLYQLLRGLDLISEEEKTRFMVTGTAPVYEFSVAPEYETERFSPDKEWMPRVVILAKSTFVWLEQLSKKYQRHIHRLDQIPDEELDKLAKWGFTGLWLIGLWERSQASKRIKQMCGNPEAVASAYSLFNYQIAQDLGGEEAYQNLKDRAWHYGIRLAGDMVPNHMAIDSRWVIEHPDWFISLDYPPYPSHTFNGPNLSWDDRIGLYLEDHYYNRTDAAVEFKRVDHHTGDTKYIYHGNDGTSMPWNDTAQLNYLNPEVREAVIQTILEVARKFSVIRFDAAMTLTKKHYQRLWYPEPGTGGDIPTRAEHGMAKSDFNAAMPEEFWREVVDRIAEEVPDTLLLAEAFWLMEGYFVRTLGMHRVYNSAFMNMLKKEENSKYRLSIKNVLEFNPEILKRFVNFMNNPDEETAIAQFGSDDKYFGVTTLLVTMPGLPMFGHGQIEGYREKYGMEYRRAYWDETPNQELIGRHEREIFPLMRKRYVFADVENFFLYDFYDPAGHVNENVFAYSNRHGNERGLVIYNNKFENAVGWIKTSASYSAKTGNGEERTLTQTNLGEGLGFRNEDGYFVIFRDHNSGLQFIRRSKDFFEKGLYVELGAFKYHVFWDFYEVQDNVWNHYADLDQYLDGRGVPNIEEALKETFLQPIHHPFKELVNINMFRALSKAKIRKPAAKIDQDLMKNVEQKISRLLTEIKQFTKGKGDIEQITNQTTQELQAFLQLPVIDKKLNCPASRKYQEAIKMVKSLISDDSKEYILIGWIMTHGLGAIVDPEDPEEQIRGGYDEWLLGKIIESVFSQIGFLPEQSQKYGFLLKILIRHQSWWKVEKRQKQPPFIILQKLLRDMEVQNWLGVNRYRDVLWFNKESFEELVSWLMSIALIESARLDWSNNEEVCKEIVGRYDVIKKLVKAEQKSDFQVSKLLEASKK